LINNNIKKDTKEYTLQNTKERLNGHSGGDI
jgi:hypothetical protein